jgi:hypothetical protein
MPSFFSAITVLLLLINPIYVNIVRSCRWQAELVVTVLRWLPEDITVYNEDLEGITHCFAMQLLIDFKLFHMCGSLITKYNGLQVTGVGSYFIV